MSTILEIMFTRDEFVACARKQEGRVTVLVFSWRPLLCRSTAGCHYVSH